VSAGSDEKLYEALASVNGADRERVFYEWHEMKKAFSSKEQVEFKKENGKLYLAMRTSNTKESMTKFYIFSKRLDYYEIEKDFPVQYR